MILKFIIITSIVVVLLVIIYVVFFMPSNGEIFSTGNKKNTPLKVENQTITELIQKDSDGDGVMDWEEGLWGTDPNNTKTFKRVQQWIDRTGI